MKNALLVIVLFAWSAAALAQQTQTRKVAPFSGVKVAEGIDVYLKKGDKESVRVEVTGTEAENVVTEVSGSYLKIHMREGRFRHVEAKVYVTYVAIDKLSASSAAHIVSDGPVKANAMEINASSGSSIDLEIEVKTLLVQTSSAAEVELRGKAVSVEAEASSAGEVDAYDLAVQKIVAEASSGASLKLSVSESLNAHASSGASIRYKGNPAKVITDSSSGGSVRRAE